MRTISNLSLAANCIYQQKEKSMKTKFNQSKIKLAIASAIVAGSMGLSATSYAATDTDTMAVSTSVLMSCTISAGAMTFGSYDPSASTDNDATATIISTCTSGGAAKITMSQGTAALTGSTDSVPLRAMKTAGDFPEFLGYHLYTDDDRAIVWGNTDATGKAITADGSAQNYTAYGRIPHSQPVSAGTFTDTVGVTLTY